MTLRFGYVTNGFRDHCLEDICAILAELGYAGIGITLDVGHLDPREIPRSEIERVRGWLEHHGLEPVIETGARFLLDPRRKHYPTLISAERRSERLAFLERAIEIAEALGARALSFWSGKRDELVDEELSWSHLLDGLRALEVKARGTGVSLAFEPEPGMFIDGLARFRELRDRFGSEALRLTLDIGHLECTEEPPHDRWIREFGELLDNVHVDDIRGRLHDHLPLGEGEIDFAPIFAALEDIDYRGVCLVELARHSHMAPQMARRSIEFLHAVTGFDSLA